MAARALGPRLRNGFGSSQWASQCTGGATRRAFSATTIHRKAVVQFNETENTEINDLLASFRREVLIPISLNKQQQKLIHREENRNMLETDPIFIKLGDEQVMLEHIDLTKMPNTRTTLYKVMDAAETEEEWENLITLFEGLQSGRKLKRHWYRRAILLAVKRDMLDQILKAFTNGKRNGFRFARGSAQSEAFRHAIHLTGAYNKWDEKSTTKALAYAERMIVMMEREPHLSTPPETRDPWIIGTALEPAAVQALKHQGGKDESGKVKLYATRLISRLRELEAEAKQNKQQIYYQEMAPFNTAPEGIRPTAERELHRRFLEIEMIPLYHGLRVAQKVLGKEMPQKAHADRYIQALESVIKKTIERFQATFTQAELDRPTKHPVSEAWDAVKSDR